LAGLFHFCSMIKNITILSLAVILFGLGSCDNATQPTEQTDEQGESSTPLDSINQLILNEPNTPEHYHVRAQIWRDKDSIQLALDDLDRSLRIDSTQDDAYSLQGDILYKEIMVKEARYVFEKCIQYNPENTNCLLKLAEIEYLLDNYAEAFQLVNDAMKVDQYEYEAYALKGDLYKETGDSALAASSYQTAIELNPQFYDGFIVLGLLYGAAGKDLAIEYYNSAIELQPERVEGLYNKAYYLQTTGFRDTSRYSQAVEIYNQIEELDPSNATANFNKGYISLEYRQDYETAEKEFSQAIQKYPGYYQAFYNRGLSLESQGRLEAARNDYKKSLQIKPTFTEAALALGRVKRNLGEE